MEIKQKKEHDALIITLSGKILGDAETCQLTNLIKTALEADNKNIILDLKQVEWMGSIGFGCITGGLMLARQKGGDLRLTGINKKVQRLLTITKLDCVFQTYPTLQQAIRSFNQNPEISPTGKMKSPDMEKTV